MLLHQGLERKELRCKGTKTTITTKLNASFHENPKANDFTSRGKLTTISHHTGFTWSMLQMVFPHHPIQYSIYSSHFWLRSAGLLSASLQLRWWLCGLRVLKGHWIWLLRLEAVCRPPLSQEMNLSHRSVFVTGEATGHLGICWFPRSQSEVFIWTNPAEQEALMLPCFAKISATLAPVHSNQKLI